MKPNNLPRKTANGSTKSVKIYETPGIAMRYAQPGDSIVEISQTRFFMKKEPNEAL